MIKTVPRSDRQMHACFGKDLRGPKRMPPTKPFVILVMLLLQICLFYSDSHSGHFVTNHYPTPPSRKIKPDSSKATHKSVTKGGFPLSPNSDLTFSDKTEKLAAKAFEYLQSKKDQYRIRDAYTDFKLASISYSGSISRTYIKLAQYVNDVPVITGNIRFIFDDNEAMLETMNQIDLEAFQVSTTPTISKTKAEQIVLNDSKPNNTTTKNIRSAELLIARYKKTLRLVWAINIQKDKPSVFDNYYAIDAVSGEILEKKPNTAYRRGFR